LNLNNENLLVGSCPSYGYLHSLDLKTRTWAEPLKDEKEQYIWNLTLGSGEDRSLDELIRYVLDRWMDQNGDGSGNPEISKLSNEEKKSISHFAFCGKIEFKDLNFDRL
jgi:hypothetical protein